MNCSVLARAGDLWVAVGFEFVTGDLPSII